MHGEMSKKGLSEKSRQAFDKNAAAADF